MADFKTALEALSDNRLELDVLSEQLDKLLKESPGNANNILLFLDETYEHNRINNNTYTRLRRQINQFRRTHPAETEAAREMPDEATVFAETIKFHIPDDDGPAPGRAASRANRRARDNNRSEVNENLKSSLTSPPSITGATGPAGSAWQEPLPQTSIPDHELGIGDVIKERFKLLDILGVGGMGKVFKGIDLLKEEARDKYPYVAIKLLNEDFKSHPEAFISLQRESSRQQKLAHPNIATVYDFDRIAGPGTPVFITMELLEGQPLNTYIKRVVRKRGGLPFPRAFEIVKQLGAALNYAHEQRLVHSDFKPGNAFLCNDGTVKALDFGIARAVKNPVTGEAEKTLFDPGKLGALTPAYASLEMLEGEEPDTRDDTYALGCVAYELLTGKHPFNKLPATTARDNGLVPAPIKGLNKKQNRALRHALAYKRKDRSPSVAHFIDEFEGKATWYKTPFMVAAEIFLVIGLIMIAPAMNYLHDQKIAGIIQEIKSGDGQTIYTKLDEIKYLEKIDQASIIDGAKDAIQSYFAHKIAGYIDTINDSYHFPEAYEVLAKVEALYPESLFLQKQKDNIDLFKTQKIADLYQQYLEATDPKLVRENPSIIDNSKTILRLIRQRIDPHHPLLTDPRVANAYRIAAEQALTKNDFKQALSFINSGLQTMPNDTRLSDLRNSVKQTTRVAELEVALTEAVDKLADLPDYRQYQKEIIELAQLSSPQHSPILTTLSNRLKSLVGRQALRIENKGSREDAASLLQKHENLLSALQLGEELIHLKLSHLSGKQRSQEINKIVAGNKSNVEQKLARPAPGDLQWESSLLASIQELDSLQKKKQSISNSLENYRKAIVQLYINHANETLNLNRFDAAYYLVDRGERFAPKLAVLQKTRARITKIKDELGKQERIQDLKDQFRFQTEADRVTEAQATFKLLQAEMAADDLFLSIEAPNILANSYARLAQRRGDNGEYPNALDLAEAGLKLAPGNAFLQGLRDDYRVEVNIVELTELFRTAKIWDTVDTARKINQIENSDPVRFTEFRKESETRLAHRINALAQSDENAAAGLASAASSVFPTSSILNDLKDRFELAPWPGQAKAITALNSGKLTEAGNLLHAAAAEHGDHPGLLAFQTSLETKLKEASDTYNTFLIAKQAAGNRYQPLRQAKKLLGRAQLIWIDNPDYDAAETDMVKLMAKAPDNPNNKILAPERTTDIASASSGQIAGTNDEWEPIASPRECTSRFAGYGKRAKAICFDFVNAGWRGPLMVVVPPNGIIQKHFAIGKYEISVGDYAKYCALSGNCIPETDKEKFNYPATGISLEEAEAYLKWLSERTGKTYRLPTLTEWEYAANAEGQQPRKDANCTVTNAKGDKKLKGNGTVSIKSGQSNGWGLKNYIGNVQEWVKDDAGVFAVGGAYSDLNSKCDISLQKPHNGNADTTTGFRVVLVEVG